MTHQDEMGRLCGDVKVEDINKKGSLEERYFILDLQEGKLKIYLDNPKHLPKSNCSPCQVIDLNFISKVSDARKLRPKSGYCFCITNAGDQMFVTVQEDREMLQWIEKLNEACRITVPDTESPTLLPSYSRNEVAGGVLVTVQQPAESDDDSEEHLPALSLPSFISGYATKQGAVRKNWKKRYFVFSQNGLAYYKYDQDKEPIKTLSLEDIEGAKLVAGQHHPHRQNLFEVVTKERTYNIQCETSRETEEWINQINKRIKRFPAVHSDALSQTDVRSNTSTQHPPSQEQLKPSRAVWDEGSPLRSGDRRSKTNVRHSKKTWSLW